MLKPEHVPPDSLGEMVRTLSDTGSYAKALAAAINAWPGMEIETVFVKEDYLILPLSQENNNDSD
jgi:hypothetical protein